MAMGSVRQHEGSVKADPVHVGDPEYMPNLENDIYQTGRLRRSTLVHLRWLGVGGQIVALAIVGLVLKFDMPYVSCFLIIGFSGLLNLLIMTRAPLDRRISSAEVGVQLLFDVVQLCALLFLTGGLQNPFSLLLLAPVVVAAKTLNKTVFGMMVGAVGLLSAGLLVFSFPLPWYADQDFTVPIMYRYGSWIALMVGMLFTASYTWRTTTQTKRMTEALAVSEAILSHERKLSALGSLAAAAAHELGTPLATISVVAKEISRSTDGNQELQEDAELLLSQTQRCRDILKNLAYRGDEGDIVHDQLDLVVLLGEITEPFHGFGIEILTEISPQSDGIAIPVVSRQPELMYGLTNIVENAVDFARSEVQVRATWSATHINLDVIDDGPGFEASILPKLGEPYISLRGTDQEKGAGLAAGGMGLGVFIAKSLMVRIGGSVAFSNNKDGGARVHLQWPYKHK
ncbi:MAG TPA: ActS/PrrB/RegB family redox-sensitive histidine kinase [Hellea balneolensis]|uniref:histidine kinase n=1 Tax=Hellea balneolensis TaxID=287478 RepID=A0A7C3GAI5_9PROT|nr:ActS/PrrB/RegB family redox-sensitive histidine kinase [Hellea balneolensis]